MMASYSMYGVTLRPMEDGDLEFVRSQRNRPDMMKWMATDHIISKEEMQQWFLNLPLSSRYYMVEWQGRVVGQVNLKGIDATTADPGYLFWDEDFSREGGVPRAVLALFTLGFDSFKYEALIGITAIDNVKALRLAKGFGFSIMEEIEKGGKRFYKLYLDKDRFLEIKRQYGALFI